MFIASSFLFTDISAKELTAETLECQTKKIGYLTIIPSRIHSWFILSRNHHLLSVNNNGDRFKWWAIKSILRHYWLPPFFFDICARGWVTQSGNSYDLWCNPFDTFALPVCLICDRWFMFYFWRKAHVFTLTLDRKIRWLILVHIVAENRMHRLVWPALWQLATWVSHVMAFAWVWWIWF